MDRLSEQDAPKIVVGSHSGVAGILIGPTVDEADFTFLGADAQPNRGRDHGSVGRHCARVDVLVDVRVAVGVDAEAHLQVLNTRNDLFVDEGVRGSAIRVRKPLASQ